MIPQEKTAEGQIFTFKMSYFLNLKPREFLISKRNVLLNTSQEQFANKLKMAVLTLIFLVLLLVDEEKVFLDSRDSWIYFALFLRTYYL